jgi:hypothetical protein
MRSSVLGHSLIRFSEAAVRALPSRERLVQASQGQGEHALLSKVGG